MIAWHACHGCSEKKEKKNKVECRMKECKVEITMLQMNSGILEVHSEV